MCSDLAFALRGVGAVVGNRFALRDVSFELPTGYVMGLCHTRPTFSRARSQAQGREGL